MKWHDSIEDRNIFIMGKAGAGKDKVADMLKDAYFYYSFTLADPIRKEFLKYFPGCNPRLCREKLIEIGETYKELYGNEVWVRLLHQEILAHHSVNPNPVVITDGRYQIEYDYFINELGYVPLRVHCEDEIRFERLLARDGTTQREALAKESTELYNANAYFLDNSRDLDYTSRQLISFIKQLGR